jgi:hypothetical protein
VIYIYIYNQSVYRVIKKSLCTWRLLYKNQVHRDFLITLYIYIYIYKLWLVNHNTCFIVWLFTTFLTQVEENTSINVLTGATLEVRQVRRTHNYMYATCPADITSPFLNHLNNKKWSSQYIKHSTVSFINLLLLLLLLILMSWIKQTSLTLISGSIRSQLHSLTQLILQSFTLAHKRCGY